MTIQCPHCSTRYELPSRLLGPRGSEVRCPRCRRKFVVGPDGLVIDAAAAPEPGEPAVPAARPAPKPAPQPPAPGASPAQPGAIAATVLDELVARSGSALAEANARGRLFAEFGPALIAAYDEYRRRLGAAAGPGPFRDALRERWGIELAPHWDEAR